jgi:hypothetical protein
VYYQTREFKYRNHDDIEKTYRGSACIGFEVDGMYFKNEYLDRGSFDSDERKLSYSWLPYELYKKGLIHQQGLSDMMIKFATLHDENNIHYAFYFAKTLDDQVDLMLELCTWEELTGRNSYRYSSLKDLRELIFDRYAESHVLLTTIIDSVDVDSSIWAKHATHHNNCAHLTKVFPYLCKFLEQAVSRESGYLFTVLHFDVEWMRRNLYEYLGYNIMNLDPKRAIVTREQFHACIEFLISKAKEPDEKRKVIRLLRSYWVNQHSRYMTDNEYFEYFYNIGLGYRYIFEKNYYKTSVEMRKYALNSIPVNSSQDFEEMPDYIDYVLRIAQEDRSMYALSELVYWGGYTYNDLLLTFKYEKWFKRMMLEYEKTKDDYYTAVYYHYNLLVLLEYNRPGNGDVWFNKTFAKEILAEKELERKRAEKMIQRCKATGANLSSDYILPLDRFDKRLIQLERITKHIEKVPARASRRGNVDDIRYGADHTRSRRNKKRRSYI